MKVQRVLFVIGVLLMLVSASALVHAQGTGCVDASGGSIPCPATAVFQDRDSDTIDDANDVCPDVSGDPANRGCPVATSTPVPGGTSSLPGFPADNGRCLIATFGDAVNIRQQPNTNAAIVGQIQPGEFAVVLAKHIVNNELWYQIALGYVAGTVVRFNEPCDRVVPTVQMFPRAAYMKVGDIKGDVSYEGAPPPSFDCYRYVVIDGNVMCLQSLPPVFIPSGTPTERGGVRVAVGDLNGDGMSELPPPPDFTCWYGVYTPEGQYVCLLREEPTLTGLAPQGGTEGLPPPDTSCFYQVLSDGSFICLIRTPPELGLPGNPNEGAPPPEPGSCYWLVIHEGQAYCLVSIPPVISLAPTGTEGAPPPEPFDCAHYVIVDRTQICLVPESISDLTAPPDSDPTAQTREHILLAFSPPADPDQCPETTALLLPAVQKVREAASRMNTSAMEMTPLLDLPPADPCAFEVMMINFDEAPVVNEDGSIDFLVDIIRVIPPTDPPTQPNPFGVPEDDGATEGAHCFGDGSGFFGCTVSVGSYSFSAWYDPDTGGHTETCVPIDGGGISCS